MPYAQFDDRFPEHPKIISLSDPAFRLWASGIAYCSRHLTDGHIPVQQVPLLIPKYTRQSLRELLDSGLWFEHADLGTVEIHDYLDWNRSRAEVEAFRQKQRRNSRRRWNPGDPNGSASGIS